MVPFGAKFGLTPEEIGYEEFDLLAIEFAKAHGYDPTGSWIIIVHADQSSEFFRFDDPSEMWCCQARDSINALIAWELCKQAEADQRVGM